MILLKNNNRTYFFLLVLALIGLLTVLAFAIATHGANLELVDVSTLRYCVYSGSVCTG